MTIWLDEHFSPKLAPFLEELIKVPFFHIKNVTGLGAHDYLIYQKAKSADEYIVLITKDFDMVKLFNELGPPPGVIWVNTYNLSNKALKELLKITINDALKQIEIFHFSTIENQSK